MPELLNIIDREIKPLVNEIDEYVKEANVDNLGTFYDADWGGIPTQSVFDKICEKTHGKKPKSYWITYAYTERPIKYARENDFEEICFLEYEPHENEISEICRNKKRVGIFGHHKGRDDIRKLCNRDFRFSYFNPRDFAHDVHNVYERGVPILYPFLKLAEKNEIDAEFIGLLGLRGYGYKKLYDEMAGLGGWEKKAADRKFDNIIDNVNLLMGYRLDNCGYVVKQLSKAENFESPSIKEISNLCARSKLPEKKNKTIGKAIMNSKILGDVQIFPIRTEFETIKPFVSDLNKLRESEKLNTGIFIQYINSNSRKVSIRTDRKTDIPKTLEAAHQGQKYKNFGGHEKAGGFVSGHHEMIDVLKSFLNSYFSETKQQQTITEDGLSFLHVDNSRKEGNGWWD